MDASILIDGVKYDAESISAKYVYFSTRVQVEGDGGSEIGNGHSNGHGRLNGSAGNGHNPMPPQPLQRVLRVTPLAEELEFATARKVPKLGVMLVGWGGKNETTSTAGMIANKLQMKWHTKEGEHTANYLGSLTQSSTVRTA
jgi:hypothetical protein